MYKIKTISTLCLALGIVSNAYAASAEKTKTIEEQRAILEKNTKGKGFAPQSPRDIDLKEGMNDIYFSKAPSSDKMNLCNIHFHRGAEHKGKEFSSYIGDGDGHGYGSGFAHTLKLSDLEKKSVDNKICPSSHGSLNSGDTIEVHYVYTTNQIKPGATLSSCLNDSTLNPQLRVEAQVYALVNDKNASDFSELTKYKLLKNKYQAINIPNDTGTPVEYIGSTTGPKYNEKASPFKVTWNVRPKVKKVNIQTVGKWCEGNIFKEDHAHAVRNLVKNPKLLSEIK